jgi:general secretion pathway protein D
MTARDRVIRDLLEQAGNAAARGNWTEAQRLFRRVMEFDVNNARAREGLASVERQRRHADWLRLAEDAHARGDLDTVSSRIRQILTEQPDHAGARGLQRRITDESQRPGPAPQLAAAMRKLVTIEFRDAPVRQVFDVLARMSGLNFVFDRDVRPDMRSTVLLRNTTVESVINLLLLTNQLEQRIVDANTIVIYPSTPAKLREYQQLVVRSFLLGTADAKQVANTIRTIVRSRDVIVDEKLNMIVVRDSPEAVRLAERLVYLHDAPEPEVMLEVEVLELKRSKLFELGIRWPGQASLSPLGRQTAGNGSTTNTLTLNDLLNLNSQSVGVVVEPTIVQARQQITSSNLLANPRIRARNREKAKVLIGDRLPTITATSTATGFVSETVTYIDAGLKLEVEPSVHPDGEIVIKIALEVSNIVSQIQTRSGTLAYQLGTRSASTSLRLRDGENQILAGLIQDDERTSANRIPGLGRIPVLGRLFGAQSDDDAKTEIVLSITPRLVRNIQRPDAAMAQFEAGTESSLRGRPVDQGGVDPLRTDVQEAPPRPADGAPKPPSSEPAGTPGSALANVGAGATAPTSGSMLANAPMSWLGPSNARVGATFALSLTMQSDVPIVGLPFVVSYDPKVIEITGVTKGEFMREGGAVTTFSSRMERNGQVVVAIARQGTTGATSWGTVATLSMRAIAPGDARVQVDNVNAVGPLGRSVLVPMPAPHLLRISP